MLGLAQQHSSTAAQQHSSTAAQQHSSTAAQPVLISPRKAGFFVGDEPPPAKAFPVFPRRFSRFATTATTPSAFGVHPSNGGECTTRHCRYSPPEGCQAKPGGVVALLRGERFRHRAMLPAVFLVAGLLAMPAYANDITISVPTGSSIYGNSSNPNGSLSDLPADYNSVTITTGATVNDVYGSWGTSANHNTVTINDGTVNRGVIGGSYSGASAAGGAITANDNTVIVNGGTIDGGVIGGGAFMPSANNYASSITANNNTVIISGGTVNPYYSGMGPAVIGGFADGGSGGMATASGNRIIIQGGTILGNVVAVAFVGQSFTGQNNSITIEGSNPLDLSGATITAVARAGSSYNPMYNISGNTLNLKRSYVTVAGLSGFQNLNFYLPTDYSGSMPMLMVNGTADITGTTVNVGINGASSALAVGDTISLLTAGTLTGTPANNNGIVNGTGMQGVTTLYDFKIYTDPSTNTLAAEVLNASSNPSAKAPAEGITAGVTTVIRTQDTIVGPAMNQAVQSASDSGSSGNDKSAGVAVGGIAGVLQTSSAVRPFGVIQGGSMNYDSGSSVKVRSLALIAGLSRALEYEQMGRATLGGFLEYGHGGYDTYNSFPNQASVHGSGNTDNIGAGVLGRLDLRQFSEGISAGRFYVDASARLGYVKSDFASGDLRSMEGVAASFDSEALYYGAHIGSGYLFAVNDRSQVDLYLRLLWTHQNGDDVRLSTGETINFDAVDSLRTVVGGRYTWVAKSWLVPYVGLAWEHEFAGDANSSVNGRAIDAPSLNGDTGMAEIGVNMGANDSKWAFDLGVQGYIGAREGVSGTLRVVYRW